MANRANVLVMQSGGSTAVLNRSLYGVVREVQESSAFGQVLGAIHALDGLVAGRVVDLSKRSKAWWTRTARTPGAVLGSSRRRLKSEDIPTVLEVLAGRGIGYLFVIGGNDSAETGHQVARAAGQAGLELAVVNVPKTIDNDLVLTDHCPGYGSAARFMALAAMGAGRDAETMGEASPITIIESMGRDAGWLAASAALARRDETDAPHLVCVPEVPIDEGRFLGQLENAYRRYGFAVAVVAENARGPDGVLGGPQEPWHVDDFGHPYHDGPARYLAQRASSHLQVRVRYEKPGTIQRSMGACVSTTDAREAEMAGRAAVRYAREGQSDVMVTLVREPDTAYRCTTGLAPLTRVAGQVRTMPAEFYDAGQYMATQAFLDYAKPLIGASLPKYSRVV